MNMQAVINEERFDFISDAEKVFIVAFDKEAYKLGYIPYNNEIGSGLCWGPYMIVYAKQGVKSKQVAARIFLREGGIVLRLYLSKLDLHSNYLENTPEHIKSVLTGDHGKCNHCRSLSDGSCKFRKTYTLDGNVFEKCNGVVFEFYQPDLNKLPDYIALLNEFYARKRAR